MPYLVIDTIDDDGVQYRAGHIVSDATGDRLSQQHGHVLTRVQEEPEHQLADVPVAVGRIDGADKPRGGGGPTGKVDPDRNVPPTANDVKE